MDAIYCSWMGLFSVGLVAGALSMHLGLKYKKARSRRKMVRQIEMCLKRNYELLGRGN